MDVVSNSRTQIWNRILDSGMHLVWAPFMVDVAIDEGYEGSIAAAIDDAAFITACRAKLAGSKVKRLPSDFNWSCASTRRTGFASFLRAQVDKLVVRVGGDVPRTSDDMEEYRSLLMFTVAQDAQRFDPNKGANGSGSGWEAYVHNFSLLRVLRPLRKTIFNRSLLHLDDCAGPKATVLDIAHRLQNSPLVERPKIFVGYFSVPEMLDLMDDEVVRIPSPQDVCLFVLCISGAMTVSDAANFLGMTRTTAYRRLADICETTLAQMRKKFSQCMGVTEDEAYAELLGCFHGKVRAVCLDQPSMGMLALLS